MTTAIVNSKKFERKNNEVRAYYLEKLETDRNLAIKINELVEIVYQEHKDWSLNKIAQHICMVNEDLDNFSSKTVYNQISDENRILLGVDTKPTSAVNRNKLQNNVMDPSFERFQTNVIEDSSIIPDELENKELGFTDYNNMLPQYSDVPNDTFDDSDLQAEVKDTYNDSQFSTENSESINIATKNDVKDAQTYEEIIDLLPKPVLRLAEKIELSPKKLELIAKYSHTSILKDHHQIQKNLVENIAPLTIDQARHAIFQKIRDLETGYLKLEGDHYIKGDSKQREIVKGGDKVLEPIQIAHMDITKSINEFLFRMTDRSITKGEFDYSKDIIKNTKDYRLSVIKVANKRILTSFENYFILVSDVALEMLELIQQEFDSRDMKKDLEIQ